MTKRRAKTCAGCGKPIGEVRVTIHTTKGHIDGDYHLECFTKAVKEAKT